MPVLSPRLQRERATLAAMVAIYCQDRHRADAPPCPACRDLQAFAEVRLVKCPFQEQKPTCAHCPIHCYRPDRRQQVREVMRHSGPRMLLRHPLLALRHWLDGFRRVPAGRSRGMPASRADA
jgi:hypothetical protein